MLRYLAILCVPLALLLSGCGQKSETFRYRLTVEVDTPEGVRSGSSVIEVRFTETSDSGWHLPEARGVRARLRGEAVAVDLPDGQVLFALLRSETRVDAAKWWPYQAVSTPAFEGEYSGIRRTRQMMRDKASGELGLVGHGPMFVTFDDLSDPASVRRVDPDDLAATFGERMTLRRITVQLTDDPVTSGIEERLGWMNEFRQMHFDGTSTVLEDMTSNELTAHLSAGSFSTEFAR